MIEKMTKYSFVLLSGDAGRFLRDLEELGVVDITRSEKPVDDNSAKLSAEVEACRKAIRHLESIDPYIPEQLRCRTSAGGYLQLLPGIHETDGFFLARLKRNNE